MRGNFRITPEQEHVRERRHGSKHRVLLTVLVVLGQVLVVARVLAGLVRSRECAAFVAYAA
jgi:hypothetical protein